MKTLKLIKDVVFAILPVKYNTPSAEPNDRCAPKHAAKEELQTVYQRQLHCQGDYLSTGVGFEWTSAWQ